MPWNGTGVDPFLPQRIAAEAAITAAERRMYKTWWGSLSSWLTSVHRSVLRTGGAPDASAIWQHAPAWAEHMKGFVQGPVRDTMGLAYRALFGDDYDFDARPAVAHHLASVHNRMVRTTEETYDLVAAAVARGAGAGESIPDIASRVDEILTATGTERWASRATTVARTETLMSLNAGRADSFAAIQEETGEAMEQIWLCVAPDTTVVTTTATHAARRHYRGPLVRIRTASGRSVAFTPEHRLLTGRGWLPAGEVAVDEEVYCVLSWAALANRPVIGQVVDAVLASAMARPVLMTGADGEATPVGVDAAVALGGVPARREATFATLADDLPTSSLVADRVIEVSGEGWQGYVYDLSTSSGWYAADGLVCHNSTVDARTRPEHAEADGQRVAVGEPFIVGGESLEYPGDPFGSASMTINCRCTTLLVSVDEEVDMSDRGWSEGADDWDDWEERLDAVDTDTPTLPEHQDDPRRLEDQARARQATIDVARTGGRAAAEFDQIVSDLEGDIAGDGRKAVEHRIGAAVGRGALPVDVADAMRVAVASGDSDALLEAVWGHAATIGAVRIERAGDIVRFDRKVHAPAPGAGMRAGDSVFVVRPGVRWVDEDLVLEKAIVEEASEAEILEARLARAAADQDALDASPAGLGRSRTGLTRAQRAALGDYLGPLYMGINRQLREAAIEPRFATLIKHIDAAMERSALTREVVVYRGVKSGRGAFGDRLDGDLTGVRWIERGYVSTSALERVADDFTYRDTTDTTPLVMRIVVPPGTGAVQMSSTFGQAELLLQRGLTLRVVRDHGVVDGVRRIDVEVLPATKASTKIREVPEAASAAESAVVRGTDFRPRNFEELIGYVLDNSARFTSIPGQDGLLAAIAERQGFSAVPRVVSRAQLDRLVAGGGRELWRGVVGRSGLSAAEIHEQMRSGRAFYGHGHFGNGIYAGSRDHAMAFAEGFGEVPEALLRLALPQDARVITYTDLYREWEAYMALDLDDDVALVLADPGRYAAARGYDAIYVDLEDSWIILNRSAIWVEAA